MNMIYNKPNRGSNAAQPPPVTPRQSFFFRCFCCYFSFGKSFLGVPCRTKGKCLCLDLLNSHLNFTQRWHQSSLKLVMSGFNLFITKIERCTHSATHKLIWLVGTCSLQAYSSSELLLWVVRWVWAEREWSC